MAVRQSSVPGGSAFLFKQLPEVEDDSLYGLRQGLWDYTGLAFGEIDAVLLLPDLTVFLRLKCPDNATCETTRLFRQQEALLRAIILDDNSQESDDPRASFFQYLATSSRLPPVDGCFYVRTDFTWRTMTSFLVGVHIMMRVRLSRHDIDLRDRVKREYWLDIQAYKVHGLDYIPTRGVSDYRLQRHANHTLGYAQYDRDFLPTRDRTDSDNLSVYTFKRTVDDVEPSNSRRLGQRPFTAVVFGVVKEVVQLPAGLSCAVRLSCPPSAICAGRALFVLQVRTLHQILALDAVDYPGTTAMSWFDRVRIHHHMPLRWGHFWMLMKSDSVDKASALAARLDRSINKILRGVVKFERVDDEAQTVLVKAYTMICIRVSTDGDWNVFSYKSATAEVEATLVRRGRIPEYRPTVFGRVSEIVAKEHGGWTLSLICPGPMTADSEGEYARQAEVLQRIIDYDTTHLGGEIVGSWVDREPSASPRITLHIPNHITDFLVDDIVNGDVLGVWVANHGSCSTKLRLSYITCKYSLSLSQMNELRIHIFRAFLAFYTERKNPLATYEDWAWVAHGDGLNAQKKRRSPAGSSTTTPVRFSVFGVVVDDETDHREDIIKLRCPDWADSTLARVLERHDWVPDFPKDMISVKTRDKVKTGATVFLTALLTVLKEEEDGMVEAYVLDVVSINGAYSVFMNNIPPFYRGWEGSQSHPIDVDDGSSDTPVDFSLWEGRKAREESALSVFKCPLCSDTVFKPVVTLCMHSVCYECLVRRLKGGARTCPSCERIIAGVPVRDNAFEMALAHAISNRGLLKSRRQVGIKVAGRDSDYSWTGIEFAAEA
ncbi:hypothetical protein C8R46DRAFT_1218162 [Mycena filopes]|nr:hypothetical protein C8R46DRAFT_1218162 [Mycena filopes]